VFRVALVLTVALASCAGSLLFLFRRDLIALFTQDDATVALGMAIMPIVAASLLGGWGAVVEFAGGGFFFTGGGTKIRAATAQRTHKRPHPSNQYAQPNPTR